MGTIKIGRSELKRQGNLKKEDILARCDTEHIDIFSISKCLTLRKSIGKAFQRTYISKPAMALVRHNPNSAESSNFDTKP